MIKEEDLEHSSDTQSSVEEFMTDNAPSMQENTVDSTVNTDSLGTDQNEPHESGWFVDSQTGFI